MTPLRYRAAWSCLGYLGIALLVYVSCKPGPHHLSDSVIEDKAEHVVAFLVTVVWFGQLYVSRRARWCVALALLALGITLEVVQQRIAGFAELEWGDVLANGLGVVVGATVLKTSLGRILSRIDHALARSRGAR